MSQNLHLTQIQGMPAIRSSTSVSILRTEKLMLSGNTNDSYTSDPTIYKRIYTELDNK